jgi:hypothetical protein
MYALNHLFSKKVFMPNLHHGRGFLVENQAKLTIVTHGGSIGTTGLILGSSNPNLKPKKMEESAPFQNLNFDKMKP